MVSTQEIYERVRDAAGGTAKLAEKVGENRTAVSNWCKRGIPDGKVAHVSAITGIPIQELRPDDWQRFVPVVALAGAREKAGSAA